MKDSDPNNPQSDFAGMLCSFKSLIMFELKLRAVLKSIFDQFLNFFCLDWLKSSQPNDLWWQIEQTLWKYSAFHRFFKEYSSIHRFQLKKQKIAVPEKKVLNNPTPKLDHFHHFAWEFSWRAQNYEIFGPPPLDGHP